MTEMKNVPVENDNNKRQEVFWAKVNEGGEEGWEVSLM